MIDLKPFCGRDDPRAYLNQPWQENGATFATNGHIGIRLDGLQDGLAAAHPKTAGRIPKLLEEARANVIPLAIELPTKRAKPCGHCGGSGYVIAKTCDECEGAGWFEKGSHTYDCKECQEAGTISTPAKQGAAEAEACWVCDGRGTLSRDILLKANGTTYGFAEKYLRLITALPAVRFFVGPDNQRVARFDFDGGSGVLMPIRL